jgi:hypothetical protein
MATTTHKQDSDKTAHTPSANGTISVSREEGFEILDRQARKYLGMSGDEFARQYRAGELPDPDRSEVARVAMLLPYAKQ